MEIRTAHADGGEHRALLDIEVGLGPSIGDRVRIRPTLEHRCPEGTHDDAEPGHTGTIVKVRRAVGVVSHTHLVVFDDPHPVMRVADRGVPLVARHYATIELEPAD